MTTDRPDDQADEPQSCNHTFCAECGQNIEHWMPVRDVEPKAETECAGFHWIGQHLSRCDGCGKPYWEHTHDMQAGDGPFGSLVPVLITDAQRDACRAKWGSQ